MFHRSGVFKFMITIQALDKWKKCATGGLKNKERLSRFKTMSLNYITIAVFGIVLHFCKCCLWASSVVNCLSQKIQGSNSTFAAILSVGLDHIETDLLTLVVLEQLS